MGALFISHCSADNALAAELVAVLAAQGHRSFFLDFDPQAGIPAGRHWEQELYAQLRACQGVIALCSERSMASAWCFAEITHARALGKPIFPIKTDGCTPWSLLRELQLTDLTQDRQRGWERLLHGLQAAGLDARGLFDWDPSRPPYPGLLAFQKADAAVYFGRGAAVQSTLETLNRLRRLGGPRLLLVLGASGSGKSSLVRAGVLPRLEREAGAWVVVPPFRPLSRPLDSMAVALATLPGADDGPSLRAALADPSTPDGWRAVVNRLRVHAGPEAGIVVTVDQFEEALDTHAAPDDEPFAFVRLIRSIADEPDGALFVLATLRSDFLGAFQTHPLLRGVSYEPIHLPQISLGEVAQVIEGPAQVAGLRLESGLSQAMVADTATDDALPLLAFTLRELFDRFGNGGGQGAELTLAEYRDQLGGLQGALARAAEALCRDAASGGRGTAGLEPLRRALLKLVRIDAEGRFVRRPCAWQELPGDAQALLGRFVQARLLVSRSEDGGERMLEVAHEALFRSWDRLAAWLAADREFLLWRERLNAASMLWRDNKGDPSLTLRGPLLAEAQRWRAERGDDLGPLVREFVAASVAVQEAAQAARERQRRRLIAALAGAVLVFGLLAAAAGWQWLKANQERRMAVARQLSAQGDVFYDRGEWQRGLLLTLHSLQSAWTPDAHAALLQRLDSLARTQPAPGWRPHPGPIRAMALSPDGRWLATAGPRHLQVQALGGEVRDLGSRNGHDYLHALAFSVDGRWLAASCEELVVCLYDSADWKPRPLPAARGVVAALAFAGDKLATMSRGVKGVRLFAMPGGEELEQIDTGDGAPEGISLSRDGRWLAVAKGSRIEIREGLSGKLLNQISSAGPGALAFSDDTPPVLAAAHGGLPIPFLPQTTEQGVFTIETYVAFNAGQAHGGDPFAAVAIDTKRFHIAATDSSAGARIARLDRDPATSLAPGSAGALVFTADGRLLVGGLDGQITAWDADDKAWRRITHAGKVHAVALSSDGRTLATASEGDTVRLIDTAGGTEIRSLRLGCDPGSLAFSADGRWLGAVQAEKLWLVETTSGRVVGPFVHEARVTSVRFEPGGGPRVATSTLWDGDIRYQVRRPTRLRVWDIAALRELGWRYDIEGDRKRTLTIAAKESLDAVKDGEGGDAALAAASVAWPEAYATDNLNFQPKLIVPTQAWLSGTTTAGQDLVDAALERAKRADGDLGDDNRFAISADGRLLASTAGTEARLWPLRFEDLEAQACQRLQRNLSRAEWQEAQGGVPYLKACPQLPDPPDATEKTATAER